MIRKAFDRAGSLLSMQRRLSELERRVGRLEHAQPPLIDRAAWFVACEMIEGDYLEFGVYHGHAFQTAYHALNWAFSRRIAQVEGEASQEQNARRKEIIDAMRFVALDSFEGLPELEGPDLLTEDFREGQYSCSEESFLARVTSAGVPRERVITVPGWFADTSRCETWETHDIAKAAIVWIDGDLYASARDALNGIGPLLQDGSVLIFDDWFAFRGNPRLGEQRAFAEWSPSVDGFDFVPFHQEGVWRKSFIAASKNPEGA